MKLNLSKVQTYKENMLIALAMCLVKHFYVKLFKNVILGITFLYVNATTIRLNQILI
jgi:hypothetical protein